MKLLKFNGTELTEETIQKTRKWFFDNCMGCIEEVKNGKVRVNNQEEYFEWRNKQAEEYMQGKNDHVVAFLQRAYFIQTGESVALFP